MFDDFLRQRAERAGSAFVPFDADADYFAYVDGKTREDGVRSFLAQPGHRRSPRATPTTATDAETVSGLGNRKNDAFLHTLHTDGVKVFDGSRRYLEAVADAGLPIAVVSSSANTREVLELTGLAKFVDQRVDGVTIREENIAGKPAPDSYLEGARRLGVEPAAGSGLRGRPLRRRGRPRRALRPRRRRRPRRPGRRVARTRRRRRRHGPRRPARRPMITDDTFPVEPWQVRETTLDLDLLAQSESVFALSNGHIGLRGKPRRGRTARAAWHLPQLVLRAPTAALRRGRIRLPRGGPDPHRRHERQDHPAAGRRRALRRPIRRSRSTTSGCSTSGRAR